MDIVLTHQLERDLLEYIREIQPDSSVIGIKYLDFEDGRYQVRCKTTPRIIDGVQFDLALIVIRPSEAEIIDGRLIRRDV